MISPAFAQTATQSAPAGDMASGLMGMLPFIFIIAIFYFLMIRPQQKKMRQHQQMVEQLRRGDKIITTAGIYATISKIVDDNDMMVQLADGIEVRMQRSMVQTVVSKPEPVNDNRAKKNAAKK